MIKHIGQKRLKVIIAVGFHNPIPFNFPKVSNSFGRDKRDFESMIFGLVKAYA